MNRWFIIAFVAVLAGAVVLRVIRLDARPMHNDEAVNAVKAATLWKTGEYSYDPREFHGPTLPYLTVPVIWFSGKKEVGQIHDSLLRFVPVIFGIGLILLLLLLIEPLGQTATKWAAAFTAISPAFVFYSRYYIHEILLIFFSLLVMATGWHYSQTRRLGWALVGGLGLGLMWATKETFVFSIFAMVCAVAANAAWFRWRMRRTSLTDTQRVLAAARVKAARPNRWHIGAALLSGIFMSQLLFTSFFTDAGGPINSLRAYGEWMQRAGSDSVHAQGWSFYFERLLWFRRGNGPPWSEGLILILAFAGGWAAFFGGPFVLKHPGFARFLTFYTIILAGIYTVISYKTPWCALGFWHGAVLLAGVGAAALVRSVSGRGRKWLTVMLIMIGCVQLVIQSWRAAVPYCADRTNPYVYAHTSRNVRELIGKVESLSLSHPEQSRMLIKVMSPGSDYWPLPWSFRGFGRTGWWEKLPEDPFAPVMIVSTKLNATLDSKGTHVMAGLFELRPDAFFELYVETNLWSKSVRGIEIDRAR